MVPRFLNTGYKFQELIGVSDVQAVVDAAHALLTALDDPASGWKAWTSLGSYTYLSPASTAMQVPQHKLQLTRTTQYRLTLQVTAMSGVILGTRGLAIPSANKSDVRIFVGDGHFCVDATCWSAVGEYVMSGTLDVTPDRIDFAGVSTVWMNGSRRMSDWARDNIDGWDQAYMQWGDDTPTLQTCATQYRMGGGSAGPRKLPSGAFLYRPRELWARVRGDTGTYGTTHWVGRCFQQLMLGDTVIVPGGRFYAPIDTGLLGQFQCLVGPTVANGYRLALRMG